FSAHRSKTVARAICQVSLDERRRETARLATRPNRLSDRRCRDAATMAHRLDAQSGPYDRRVVSCERLAALLASRGGVVLGYARRRRLGEQLARLAMDRRLRRGRRALLPGVQSDEPRGEVRPGRRLRPTLCAG